MNKILIQNPRIINEGRSFIGSVLVEGDKIAAVFEGEVPGNVRAEANQVIDATGKWLIPGVIDDQVQSQAVTKHVLIVDDSSVARKQVLRCLQTVGVEVTALNDGREALNYLKKMADEGHNPDKELLMLISDIEMPEMDGYTLTTEIRSDPRMQKLHILLHTSLSGVFNQAMVKKVGADDFLAKFKPDDLAARVVDRIRISDGG